MAASILEIVSVATNDGEMMENRWHFVNEAGSEDASLVLPAFITSVIDEMIIYEHAGVVHTELLWRIITNPLQAQQIYPITPNVVGTNTGAHDKTFVCATIRWSLGTTVVLTAESPQRRVRRGSKHLGGVTEDYSDGQVWSATAIPHFEDVAEGYLGMSDGGFIPCVCGFPKRAPHVPGTPSVPAAPPNKYCLITGFSVNRNVGSEVSRKVGHGA